MKMKCKRCGEEFDSPIIANEMLGPGVIVRSCPRCLEKKEKKKKRRRSKKWSA